MVDSKDTAPSSLRDLRDSIDNIDAAMIHILAERFRCTKKVGALKAKLGLPPADPDREAEQVSRLRHLASVAKLDPDFAEKFLAFVIREVIRHHESRTPVIDGGSPALQGIDGHAPVARFATLCKAVRVYDGFSRVRVRILP
jgi:chorismate mutase